MGVRIETKEIPARTIEICVIDLPANEWRWAKWKTNIFYTLWMISAIVSFLSFMAWAPTGGLNLSRHLGLDILNSDSDAFKWVALLTVAILLVVFINYKIATWISSIKPNLYKRHGWDGKSEHYRIETSEGGAWFD